MGNLGKHEDLKQAVQNVNLGQSQEAVEPNNEQGESCALTNAQNIPPIDTLPGVFRISAISESLSANGRATEYRAELFNERASMTVSFNRSTPDLRMKADMLVSIRWKLPVTCIGGAIQISRLVLLEQPIKGTNLFETVPFDWVKDRSLVNRAKTMLEALPDNLQHLITAILWNGVRFRHFCDRPASVADHHAYRNGNLLHTVEVAETVTLLAGKYPQANLGICQAAAFLHDVGKASEYNQWKNGEWGMTDRGRLVGHRHTVLEWIAVAVATNRINLPEKHYLSLIHSLTSVPNAEWLGIRQPATPEAMVLSMADRFSGESALTAQLAKQTGGWGEKHPHRKSKPYTLPVNALTTF
jgi:3'-5' exoribonuclease